MSNDHTNIVEVQRMQFAISLKSAADSLRQAAERAEIFAKVVQDGGFNSAAQVDGGAKRKRKPRDPNAPKRPASSYLIFQNEVRKDLKDRNPNLNNQELMLLIGKLWAEMPEKDKQIYNNLAATAKQQYSQEKEAYAARSPHEINVQEIMATGIPAKKAKQRNRNPKTPMTVPESPIVPPIEVTKSLSSESSDNSESDTSDEEEDIPKAKKGKITNRTHDSEEESSEEDEEEEVRKELPIVLPTPPTKPSKVKSIQQHDLAQSKKKKSQK